jgi:hypothetical protein
MLLTNQSELDESFYTEVYLCCQLSISNGCRLGKATPTQKVLGWELWLYDDT